MDCNRIAADLDAYLDGELDAAARSAFAAHLHGCGACRKRVSAAQAVQAAVAALPVAGPGDGYFARALHNAALGGQARARRTPRLVAAGFLGAFAASILTVILTGLWVRAPRPDGAANDVPAVSLAVNETRTVNLVFDSREALDGVELTVDLPRGVELRGHEGEREVAWHTRLQAGNNLLPLELVAIDGRGGRLVARLRHDGKEKTFIVNVAISLG